MLANNYYDIIISAYVSLSASVITAASVAAVLFIIILCFVLVLGLVWVGVLYRRGLFICVHCIITIVVIMHCYREEKSSCCAGI
jgi:uncharacterized protein (DUF983 family)